MANEKDYMPTESGLALGDRGDQVERVQEYLMRFGYIESGVAESFGLEPVPGFSAPAPEDRGVFDDNTVAALSRFQSFNHLPITGELDQATVDLMSQPRCGVPDNAEFTTTGRRWPTTNLTYAFQEFTPDLAEGDIVQQIEQAFALWNAETRLCFTRVAMNAAPHIIIRFVPGDHGDGLPFDGASGILAHAFFPPVPPNPPTAIQGDTHFDEAETWSNILPPPAGTFDLATVAAHEFGHALGLDHSSVAGALMEPFYAGPHRFLASDDILGIQAIYGTYPIAHASWIHGSSVQVWQPQLLERITRTPSSTSIVGQRDTFNWFHFAIPTPEIVNDDRKVVGPVIIRCGTRGTQTVVERVHISNDRTLIADHSLRLRGDTSLEQLHTVKLGVPHCPPVEFGLNVSVGVRFGLSDLPAQRTLTFYSAGCHFRP